MRRRSTPRSELFTRPYWRKREAAVRMEWRLLSRPLWACQNCYERALLDDDLESQQRAARCNHEGHGLTAMEFETLRPFAAGDETMALTLEVDADFVDKVLAEGWEHLGLRPARAPRRPKLRVLG